MMECLFLSMRIFPCASHMLAAVEHVSGENWSKNFEGNPR
jgi:hypothetical protein